ncbi:MAG: tRNA pseudouridine(38-40) synthase TruA [Gammaproteobacteria bacterium]|nr:MAG: tRNA pseudouridine(38-40) synthase TruA [Gammaproteobacteria bacterium]
MTRWALGVEYDGSCFHGFQRQSAPGVASVQGDLEGALGRIADHPVRIVCAGRTDAGVHATGQVIHFDSTATRSERDWQRGGNTLTHQGICIHWAKAVDATFSARFSARWRRYLYLLTDQRPRQALLRDRVAVVPGPLDAALMHDAAQALVGEHDFSSFRAAQCQASHPRREIQSITVRRSGQLLGIEIQANAFLQHMVRNITGSLLQVGLRQRDPKWMAEILLARDRTQAGIAAPPEGLYLTAVGYGAEWSLPTAPSLPWPGMWGAIG